MLKVLREKAGALHLDLPCVCGNLVELGMFADASFDHAACLFSTLGLIVGADARRRFIAHVARILRPDGVFVVHVHNRWFNIWTSQGRRLLAKDLLTGSSGDYAMPAHDGVGSLLMHLFTRREIVNLLRSVGFETVEVRPVSLQADGKLSMPWWFGRLRAYGYLIAARKPAK
jgi:SAM-dependent methyltransferase